MSLRNASTHIIMDCFLLTGLQGIYDNGCGMDHNEAVTASYLYPELFNVTSRSPNDLRRVRSQSVSSSVSSSASFQPRSEEEAEHLTIKRWVLVVLILCLIMTFSLLVGISLQHFELLRKFLDTKDAQDLSTMQPTEKTSTSTESSDLADFMDLGTRNHAIIERNTDQPGKIPK
jgi:hypothetical protein